MTYNNFIDRWNDLADSDKINCFMEYANEHNFDDLLYYFDEEFFKMFFPDPVEAARAVYFGNIECWSDEYIRFNGYGNLESLSESQAANFADDFTDEIYEHEEIWLKYIDDVDDDNDD